MDNDEWWEEREDKREDEEWVLDEVTGMRKKPALAALNRRKLSKYEMDDLFAEE